MTMVGTSSMHEWNVHRSRKKKGGARGEAWGAFGKLEGDFSLFKVVFKKSLMAYKVGEIHL